MPSQYARRLHCLVRCCWFLIFPRFNWRFLAPVALTPLLIALAQTPRAGQRFIYGWGAGIVYWFFLCTWIQFVLQVHAAMGVWGGWGSFLVFCILKALHLARIQFARRSTAQSSLCHPCRCRALDRARTHSWHVRFCVARARKCGHRYVRAPAPGSLRWRLWIVIRVLRCSRSPWRWDFCGGPGCTLLHFSRCRCC